MRWVPRTSGRSPRESEGVGGFPGRSKFGSGKLNPENRTLKTSPLRPSARLLSRPKDWVWVHFLAACASLAGLASEAAPVAVEIPEFSETRGYRAAPFELALRSATPAAEILYTLDGSAPDPARARTYREPLRITTTTVVRAKAVRAGFADSPVETHSFLFPRDIAVQSAAPPPGYPERWTDAASGAAVTADYGMIDSAVRPRDYARAAGDANQTVEQARAALAASILALPALSVVTDPANLFDAERGLYLHPANRGPAWERPVSVELLTAEGSESWQADAGVHVMGLTSRSLATTPKLNFMLIFNPEYGEPWLREPFFGRDGPDRIKRIALRSNTRDGWVAEYFGSGTATYLADGFAKDTARELGEPSTRHRYVHLFLNGLYWGLYNPTERPEEHWAETTWGGEDEDYDVLDLCCGNQLESGDFTAWNQLLRLARDGFASPTDFWAMQGRDPAGTPDLAIRPLLDLDNFIGFALQGYYHASVDWPGNFFAIYDRGATRPQGWRFVTWDTDLGLPNFAAAANKVTAPEGWDHPWWRTSPGEIDHGLRANPEYRLRLADRVYREFFHDGVFTPGRSLARWKRLRDAVLPALYAESARWGDYRPGGLRTVQDHWLPRVDGALAQAWFARRTSNVVEQLREAGLYPRLDPPGFDLAGGEIPPGSAVRFRHPEPAAELWLTLDGEDPRRSASARRYLESLVVTTAVHLRARARLGSIWSALHEEWFRPAQDWSAFECSEIHYQPPDVQGRDGREAEFLEFRNVGPRVLDLAGLRLEGGVQYTFGDGASLSPGETWVLAGDALGFARRFPGVLPHGILAGRLANEGELLTLRGPDQRVLWELRYQSTAPWPVEAAGMGASLQRSAMGLAASDPRAWVAASPTPGAPTPSEFIDADVDGLPDDWERRYGLEFSPGEFVAAGDPDADGLSNFAEYGAGTDPLDAGATLRVEWLSLPDSVVSPSLALAFRARAGRTYSVLGRSPDPYAVWNVVTNFESSLGDRDLRIRLPDLGFGASRWFRVVTPRVR